MVPGTVSDAAIQIGVTGEGNIAGGTAGKIGAILVTAGNATSVKLERPAAFGLTAPVSAVITASSLQFKRYIHGQRSRRFLLDQFREGAPELKLI